MKKRLLPAISIGIAVLLIGGIAYAADRKKNAKTTGSPTTKTHDEEALKAELLEAVEHSEKKQQHSVIITNVAAVRRDDINTDKKQQQR